MAVYGEFDLRFLNVKPEDKDFILSGEFYKIETVSSGKKILIPIYNYKNGILILDEFLKKVNSTYNIIIISNFVYVDAPDNKKDQEIDKIIENICDMYGEKLKSKITLKNLLKLYFLYYLEDDLKNRNILSSLNLNFNKNKPKKYKDRETKISFYDSAYWPKQALDKAEDITKKSGSTEFNEFLNFIFFYYRINRYQKIPNLSFLNYLIAIFDINGYSRAIPKNVSLNPSIEISSGFDFKKTSDTFKSNILPLLCEYNGKLEYSYITSAKLTYAAIQRTRLFDDTQYEFFSESSPTYKEIFGKISDIIKSSKIFDKYFRLLNINKYFISDFLAIKKSKKGIILSNLNELIDEFSRVSSRENLSKIFFLMDEYFTNKDFIPISLKMIEKYSNEKLPVNTISKEQVKSSIVKIINPPLPNIQKYKNINLDDYDSLLLELIEKIKLKTNFNKEFEKIIKIIPDSFQYSDYMFSTTYGNSSYKNFNNLYFEFDLHLTNTDKKTYTFEISSNIKIRTKGTASSTGEGTINSDSLNYVMRQIYKGKFNSKLIALTNNRKKILFEPKTTLEKQYVNIMKSYKILTPSFRYDNNASKLKKIILSKNSENCRENLLEYYNSLTKDKKVNELKTETQLGNLLGKICGKELGMLLDKNIELDTKTETVNVLLSDSDKNKIIATVWGLIAARGPIQFEEEVFRTAKEIRDVLKYQIKLPALVKIGI